MSLRTFDNDLIASLWLLSEIRPYSKYIHLGKVSCNLPSLVYIEIDLSPACRSFYSLGSFRNHNCNGEDNVYLKMSLHFAHESSRYPEVIYFNLFITAKAITKLNQDISIHSK